MKKLAIASVAVLALTSQAFALTCESRTIDVPDIVVDGGTEQQDVFGLRTFTTGVSSHNGTAYTKATFCPKAAAAGTCTGESLSEPVSTHEARVKVGEVTVDLPDSVIVTPDDDEYRVGIYIPLPGPDLWVGSNWKDGTCP